MTTRRKVTRPRVMVLTSPQLLPHFFPGPALDLLESCCDWKLETERQDTPELREKLRTSDALLTTWHSPYLSCDMLGENPSVQLICHCGGELKARMEDRVLDTVTVTNAPEPMARPVAEMALAMTLALVRRLPEYESQMRAGHVHTNDWAPEGETLIGRTVGVIGFGRIGQAFAGLVRPFGVRLLVVDPYCPASVLSRFSVEATTLEDLLEHSAVVVLTAALTEETRHLLDRRRLALLRHGACVINVGRGGLVDLEALTEALRQGRIRAALDVTDPLEPLPADHELRRLSNVLLTPHIAAGGVEVRRAMGEVAISELRRFFSGKRVRNRVTRTMLTRMT